MYVRPATDDDLPAVLNVLDGAALATDPAVVRAAVGDDGASERDDAGGRDGDEDDGGDEDDDGRVSDATTAADPLALVAVAREPADPGAVVGALVLEGDRIEAVAVRRRRRNAGIGSALVAAAAERRERLVARCDPDVRPFYESLGFDVAPVGERETSDEAGGGTGPRGDGRLRGVYEPE